ncbi:MAG TPA: type II secretion system protein GspL [Ramlibacter sp.]|uniref:type II secretion system protein GspL n=1 Tax=Ramlibacter sp. TaxID=1917967 RepID=UPI002D16EAF3|nr:type II secretion system protein GspL [Ramlibacter sp.]HVZ44264.1 type II secretion system protein GspL [Ramlibacter sp.]
MSSLIVLLPAAPSPTSEFAFVVSPDRRTMQQHGSAPVALLPRPRGAGAEVVAVVPAQALSWHRVELPKGVTANSPRLRGVLEGLLEERLLDEPDTLHFALQPHAASGAVWIAACDRAWLRHALQLFEAADRAVMRIVPELAPEGAGRLHAMGEPDNAWLAWAGEDGVLVLPLAATSIGLLPAAAAKADCIAAPAVAALAEQVLHRKVEILQAPQRWLAAAQSDWDLAQFEFASSGRTRAIKKLASGWVELLRAPQWRAARWGAVLLVALNVIGLNAWALKEHNALEAQRESIRRILTQTFPNVKVVVDAPVQMERETAALRQATGMASGRDLEAMLAALALAAPPGRSIASVDFAPGELRVRGLGLSPVELRPIALNLKSMGYAASPQGDTLVLTQEGAP